LAGTLFLKAETNTVSKLVSRRLDTDEIQVLSTSSRSFWRHFLRRSR